MWTKYLYRWWIFYNVINLKININDQIFVRDIRLDLFLRKNLDRIKGIY